MRVELHSARVYASKSRYGDTPRSDPLGGPLFVEDLPSKGRTARFTLGDVPEAVKTAWRVRKTFARMAARALGGHEAGEDKQAVAEQFFASDEPAFPTESWNWYVTVEISGRADISDEAIVDRKFGWIDWSESLRLLDAFGQECGPHLDRLVSYLALFIEEGFFSDPVAEVTFLAADGRLPIAWPRIETAVEMNMTYAASRLDVVGLREFTAHLSKHPEPAKSPLDTPRHWFLQAIGEEDPARRFMMCFWALEVLANKFAAPTESGAKSAVRKCADYLVTLFRRACGGPQSTLERRFSRFQRFLALEADASDLVVFKNVKKARDQLSHGGWRDLGTLPVPEAYQLMKKYFLAALKRELG